MNKREEIQSLAKQAIIENNFNLIVDIAPRVGKSKILIDAIKDKEDWNICISSPFQSIRNNWTKEAIKWNLGFDINSICSRSLNKIDSDLDLLVLDEIQTLSTGQLETIIKKKPKRILGLTGTLADSTMLKLYQYLNIMPLFRYSIEQAIADKIISNYHVYIILCDLDQVNRNVLAGPKDKQFYTTESMNYIFLSKKFEEYKEASLNDPKLESIKMRYASLRTALLYGAKSKFLIAKKIVEMSQRCLIFTGLINTANQLSSHSHHSKNKKEKNLDKFIEEEINKLCVVEMVNMGITIPNLKTAIIHQLKSDPEMSWQKILRVCNLEDDKEAKIFITTYNNTVDLGWTMQALKGIETDKVSFIQSEDFLRNGIKGKRLEKFNDLLKLQ